MEKVIFSKGQGLGIILDNNEFLMPDDIFSINIFVINNENITPGMTTNLSGFFDSDVVFYGALKDDPKVMCFYLGDDTDLFNISHYFLCLYYITNKRIFTKFTEKSGRDFNFVNGKWK